MIELCFIDISLLSARFSRNGYCWLVSGQTAYVWLASSSNRITVNKKILIISI